MTANLRGPHHCVGLANAIAEMLFQYLERRCASAGGSLTSADLKAAHGRLFESMPRMFDFFESHHARCMQASASTAPAPFSRENILATLLQVCNEKSARHAFPMQVHRFGAPWLHQFFMGLSQYIRQQMCPTADARLLTIYVKTAGKVGPNLSIEDLLQDPEAQQVLRDCHIRFLGADAIETLAKPMSDVVSRSIAEQRGIPHPDLSKVTEQEARSFLTWLPRLLFLTLPATPIQAVS